ncbi:MAG: peptide chain release factor N(5)-glutamine methyltransferase [Bacteroidetes Order II. Incertae sedis bacterium]|nr:peptide chain release factor N(5)-glutamine methyltransferase [Bacteroidetes Order II. bacterium]
MTYRDLKQASIHRLMQFGLETPEANLEVRWLLEHLTGWSGTGVLLHLDDSVTITHLARWESFLHRRIQHEPIQYIIGTVPFLGLTLKVNPNVLIPRPETEWLTHWLSTHLRGPLRILDVGTGSGCIALGLKHLRPEYQVTACDVSIGALEVARENAQLNQINVQFYSADMLDPMFPEVFHTPFNLIVSNPPYVLREEAHTLQNEVIAYEPHLALFTEGEPLRFYRALVLSATKMLAPGGWVALECHTDFADDVKNLLEDSGFFEAQVIHDLSNKPRLAIGKK